MAGFWVLMRDTMLLIRKVRCSLFVSSHNSVFAALGRSSLLPRLNYATLEITNDANACICISVALSRFCRSLVEIVYSPQELSPSPHSTSRSASSGRCVSACRCAGVGSVRNAFWRPLAARSRGTHLHLGFLGHQLLADKLCLTDGQQASGPTPQCDARRVFRPRPQLVASPPNSRVPREIFVFPQSSGSGADLHRICYDESSAYPSSNSRRHRISSNAHSSRTFVFRDTLVISRKRNKAGLGGSTDIFKFVRIACMEEEYLHTCFRKPWPGLVYAMLDVS